MNCNGMKYTDYILSERPYHPEGLVALPTVIIAVPVLTGFLAGALVMDGGRYIKLRLILHKREQSKIRYIRSVLSSLDIVPTNQLISLLKAA